MAEITFVTPSDEVIKVDATEGTLMQAAVANLVEGIDGDCGGGCACATCHVHVDPSWIDRLGRAEGIEEQMLEFEEGASEYSRLCCQINVSRDLDGLVLKVVGR